MTAISPRGPQVSIRILREMRGMTLVQLADRIADNGYGKRPDPDHLSNVERGNKKPSERLMVAWAKALGADDLEVWIAPLMTAAAVA